MEQHIAWLEEQATLADRRASVAKDPFARGQYAGMAIAYETAAELLRTVS